MRGEGRQRRLVSIGDGCKGKKQTIAKSEAPEGEIVFPKKLESKSLKFSYFACQLRILLSLYKGRIGRSGGSRASVVNTALARV